MVEPLSSKDVRKFITYTTKSGLGFRMLNDEEYEMIEVGRVAEVVQALKDKLFKNKYYYSEEGQKLSKELIDRWFEGLQK